MFRLKPLAAATLLGTMFTAHAALAQEEQLESSTIEAVANESAEANTGTVEEVVVTGSRLRSSTYSSISPLQIIDAEFQREVGLIDATEILQNSTNAGGQQIDLTFNGFVLDNGPGSSTISLRGLGANRTLVLMNGRRLAPSGVEGAPSAPNISLVPQLMISRYENLLDAGSSIYGSDAIAGATNIITRKDFDGLEIQVFADTPDRNGGESSTISAAWGFNTDKSVFGIGIEYAEQKRVRYADRPWTNECTGNVEITESGEIRRQDLYYANLGYPDVGQCSSLSLAGRTFISDIPAGSIYYTPGTSNGGWPNFSESADPFLGVASDGNGDGIGDIDFLDYNLNGAPSDLNSDLFPKSESMNILAYGETTLDGDMNITPYFEAMYNTYEVNQNSGEGQLFPNVPALNPYNLCNPNQPNGVDCGLAYGAYLDNPGIQQQWIENFGAPAAFFRDVLGLDFVGGTAIGPVDTLPIVSVRGDRNLVDVEMEQARIVFGATADLPFLDVGTLSNWRGDISIAYNRSEGDSSRYGVREDRLELALGYYSSTSTPCENDTGANLAADTAGCVPVNMYAPSLYPVGTVTGDFETQAERDYLFDSRDFNTVYEQTLLSLVLDGDIFEMPGGEMAQLAVGVEYRNDDIQSNPDAVARDGLFWGFFADKGAFGDVSLTEVFAEVQLPLIADKPMLKELTVNLAGRLTDHEYYGENDTASVKVGYRPSEPFLVRATWGTAFRAPNNRELFLLGSTGFTNVFDPCYVPEAAIANDPTDPDASGQYNPALDQRDPELLANCRATGVDPTLANNGGFNTFSTEVQQGGSLTLDPEESESFSYGFSYEQDFSNKFDLSMGMTYYSVKVENTVIEPSTSFIISDCLYDEAGTGASVFCDRISRDFSDPTDPRIQLMDLGFINRDLERARGIDYNLTFRDVIDLGVPVDFSVNLTANRNLERSLTFTNPDGTVDFERYEGEWGYAEWRALGQVRLSWDRWTMNWQTRYLGAVSQDVDTVDEFSEATTLSDTCLGPPDDELCRDLGETGSYMVHNVSLFYREDNWTLGMGVRNLEDKAPPLADPSEVLGVKARPIGYGYDVFGRTFFVNASYNFDIGF